MIDLGFVDEKTMEIEGKSISRRKVFERLLEETLTFQGRDVMLIRVSAQGMKDGMNKRWNYQTIQYEDLENNMTAMMRATSFPATIVLEMLVDGRIKDKGVLRQELSIPADLFLEELAKRHIKFEITEG